MIGDVGIIISTMRGADFALPADFVVVVFFHFLFPLSSTETSQNGRVADTNCTKSYVNRLLALHYCILSSFLITQAFTPLLPHSMLVI